MRPKFLFGKGNGNWRQRYQALVVKSMIDDRAADDRQEPEGSDEASFGGIAMLDVIACALGAVILVAVLQMVIRAPVKPPLVQDFMLAEVCATGPAEFGFMVTPPGSPGAYYIFPRNSGKHNQRQAVVRDGRALEVEYFTGQSLRVASEENLHEQCAYTAHLYVREPAVGQWVVRPYYYQFYRSSEELDDEPFVVYTSIDVVHSFWTKNGVYEFKSSRAKQNEEDSIDCPDSIDLEVPEGKNRPFPGGLGCKFTIEVTA